MHLYVSRMMVYRVPLILLWCLVVDMCQFAAMDGVRARGTYVLSTTYLY